MNALTGLAARKLNRFMPQSNGHDSKIKSDATFGNRPAKMDNIYQDDSEFFTYVSKAVLTLLIYISLGIPPYPG